MTPKELLSCWHKLEYFSPAPVRRSREMMRLADGEPEPWAVPQRPLGKNQTFEYTIYLGVFDLQAVGAFVREYFEDDRPLDRPLSGNTAFASLKLDVDGHYINYSFGLSTLPWAMQQLEGGQIDTDRWDIQFNLLKSKMEEEIGLIFKETITNLDGEVMEVDTTVTHGQLGDFQEKIVEACGWSAELDLDIRVKQTVVHVRTEGQKVMPPADILNSFYASDLEKILNKFNPQKLPKAFGDYLNGGLCEPPPERTDVTADVADLRRTLRPNNMPDGCWPAPYQLNLMQQLAVNKLHMAMMGDESEGLQSVNGPPGTGKTTLLRDLIASIVVERAKKLVEYDKPWEAFSRIGNLEIKEGYDSDIYAPAAHLTHGGIVVASTNNGAVENISKELPFKGQVSEPFQDEIGYFKSVAENCLDWDYWGLISVVLGNSRNRNAVVDGLWFNKDYRDLKQTFKEDTLHESQTWYAARAEFEAKLSEIKAEKQRLESFRSACLERDEVAGRLNAEQAATTLLQTEERRAEVALAECSTAIAQLKVERQAALEEVTIIKSTKPGLITFLSGNKRRLAYEQAVNAALTSFTEIKTRLGEQETALPLLQKASAAAAKAVADNQGNIEALGDRYAVLNGGHEEARKVVGKHFADRQFWAALETQAIQEVTPWHSEKLHRLQSELFLLALRAQETFLLTANDRDKMISRTLASFFNYLKGHSDVTEAEARAMWDTFFLVVPVVSTTFASVQRMFADLGPGSLPWLMIDEAGQAVPQAAAGAIYRARRVVVVGDPLQIEPVMTVPPIVTEKLRAHLRLTAQQVAGELSVQSLADRVSPYGTWRTLNERKQWIGLPLRIHRRCLEPMFSIANRIAYDGTMFSSTPEPEDIPLLLKTTFHHCTGRERERHYVLEHAELVKVLLLDEINHAQGLPDVFVITPFTNVAAQLRGFLFEPLYQRGNAWSKLSKSRVVNWIDTHVGTVHTFQGKQAAGVILCLGLEAGNHGAAAWASRSPNLLNVAVTRSRFRLAVVGDRHFWGGYAFFGELVGI